MPANVAQRSPYGFHVWLISEIYLGYAVNGITLFIPSIDDLVVDYLRGFLRVTGINENNIPTLEPTDFSALTQAAQGANLINRLAPYQQMMRVFLDTSVTPYRMDIDKCFTVNGSDVLYMKVFLGNDTTVNGNVISQVYDVNGNVVSENVSLSLVDPNNPTIKTPNSFNCSTALQDGETVTTIFYTLDGNPVRQQDFLVKNTNFIRAIGQSQKYIESIDLVSNLIDTVVTDVVNAPFGIPISGSNFNAQLTYNDGTTEIISVGTNKCVIFGLETFNPYETGVYSDITLVYYLDPNESAVTIGNPNSRSITHSYRLRAVSNSLQYVFKVFVVPKYNRATQTYSNDYYLSSLDRTIFEKLNATQYTIYVNGGGILNNGNNTNSQQFTIAVNVGNVISEYQGFILPEAITIKYGINGHVGWIIDYLNNATEVYGANVFAEYSVLGNQNFSVQCNQTSLTNWLQTLWKPLHALFDQSVSLSPPTPTHMAFMYQNETSPIVNIAQYWNITQQNTFSNEWISDNTLSIVWYHLEADNVTYTTLGISPLPLVNTLT